MNDKNNRRHATSSKHDAIFLTRRELAARWGCKPRTIGSMEKTGLLRSVRFSQRNLRYAMRDILAIEQNAGRTAPSLPGAESEVAR